jgi:hypothetical protein
MLVPSASSRHNTGDAMVRLSSGVIHWLPRIDETLVEDAETSPTTFADVVLLPVAIEEGRNRSAPIDNRACALDR